jgi:uncharacterized membrane protein YeaQ/YmgE (transglycosylase-associated protein family)
MFLDPIVNFIIILVIGIAAAIIYDRFGGTSWLSRQTNARRATVTGALVGIAGAFIGYNLFAILGLAFSGAGLLIGAIIGAGVTLWAWRTMK